MTDNIPVKRTHPGSPTGPRTVAALFLDRVGRTPEAEAFRHPSTGGWQSLTWRDTERRVRAIACGLRALGLAAEERCAILSSTRLEWLLCDLAILCAGGATTTLYPSSTGEECAFILSDSGSAFAFVEDVGQLAKLASRRGELPALRRVIVLDGAVKDDGFTLSLAALEVLGRADEAAHPGGFEQTAEAVPAEALATLVYTSGTTGRPKGVELTHAGWVAQAEAVDAARILDHPEPLQLFWLPLAHVFGKMIGTAQLRIGFPTAVDGRLEKLVENFATIRPTFVCAVPRIFEKVHQRIVLQARAGGAVRRAVFAWAVGVGRERARVLAQGGSPSPLLAVRWVVADRLVLRKVRALFGGRLRFFVSGSAPLSREVAELFEAAGVMILEGYGLTESAAATHVDLPYRHKPGTVGPPLPGVEVKLAEDGEVLMRGPWIMRGYHGQAEASAEALQGGWLHTGDVGTVDADGFLTLTDRKKDLIKTSGGKYVAPQELEGRLKALSPLVSQVLVHGDRRSYVTALVTLDPAALSAWAAREGMGGRGAGALAGHPALRAELQRAFDLLNAGLPRFATVKKFTVLAAEFSEGAGEVTPSHKLKRKLIEQRYREALDALYGEPARLP
jgi:long-chain acyl-CoA synthetase